MITFFEKYFTRKRPSKPKTRFELAIENLDVLHPYQFKRVYSSDLSVFMLSVPVKSVTRYIQVLKDATHGIKTETGLFKNEFIFEYHLCNIGDFFLTNNGYYLDDILGTAKQFLNVIRVFLVTYEALTKEDNLSPVSEHNRRILANLASNAIEIISQLKML